MLPTLGAAVMLPPLRNRFDDLNAIASQLLGRTVQLCPDLDTRLRKHCWPGNLREFRNFLMTQLRPRLIPRC